MFRNNRECRRHFIIIWGGIAAIVALTVVVTVWVYRVVQLIAERKLAQEEEQQVKSEEAF